MCFVFLCSCCCQPPAEKVISIVTIGALSELLDAATSEAGKTRFAEVLKSPYVLNQETSPVNTSFIQNHEPFTLFTKAVRDRAYELVQILLEHPALDISRNAQGPAAIIDLLGMIAELGRVDDYTHPTSAAALRARSISMTNNVGKIRGSITRHDDYEELKTLLQTIWSAVVAVGFSLDACIPGISGPVSVKSVLNDQQNLPDDLLSDVFGVRRSSSGVELISASSTLLAMASKEETHSP